MGLKLLPYQFILFLLAQLACHKPFEAALLDGMAVQLAMVLCMSAVGGVLSMIHKRKLAVKVFLDIDGTILQTYDVNNLLAAPITDGNVAQFLPMLEAFMIWREHFLKSQAFNAKHGVQCLPAPNWTPTAIIDGIELKAQIIKLTPDAPEAPCLVQEVLTKDKKLLHIVAIHISFEVDPAGDSNIIKYHLKPHFTVIPAETAALGFLKYDLPEVINHSCTAVAKAYGSDWPADSKVVDVELHLGHRGRTGYVKNIESLIDSVSTRPGQAPLLSGSHAFPQTNETAVKTISAYPAHANPDVIRVNTWVDDTPTEVLDTDVLVLSGNSFNTTNAWRLLPSNNAEGTAGQEVRVRKTNKHLLMVELPRRVSSVIVTTLNQLLQCDQPLGLVDLKVPFNQEIALNALSAVTASLEKAIEDVKSNAEDLEQVGTDSSHPTAPGWDPDFVASSKAAQAAAANQQSRSIGVKSSTDSRPTKGLSPDDMASKTFKRTPGASYAPQFVFAWERTVFVPKQVPAVCKHAPMMNIAANPPIVPDMAVPPAISVGRNKQLVDKSEEVNTPKLSNPAAAVASIPGNPYAGKGPQQDLQVGGTGNQRRKQGGAAEFRLAPVPQQPSSSQPVPLRPAATASMNTSKFSLTGKLNALGVHSKPGKPGNQGPDAGGAAPPSS